MRVARIVSVAALVAACGESKPAAESAPAPAGSAMGVQPPPPDRIGAAPDMTVKPADPVAKRKADTAKPAAPMQKADDRLRDSAFGPKFTVDSTGKVTKIKKP